ncbi:hypothetical protein [Algoriphagus sp.]|uniref:hypothetical protein n=1 Tax=Algoriphagus sp. TaxID=1872435 RepID=UPI0025D94785|nr:hypothetical protein [Algoriphagus sp.]
MEENITVQTQVAFHNLNGLIRGIAMDGRITKSEFDAIKSWCQTHDGLCDEDPFKSLHSEIIEKIKTGILGSEEIHEINDILNRYAPEFEEKDKVKADLHFLQGICYGIMADGDINKYELNLLQKWLDDNYHLSDQYPFNEITEVVKKVIDVGKIGHEEYNFLVQYFKEFLKID